MPALLDPIETIRAHLASWDTPFVDLDTFGTADPEAIVSLVDAFCREHLASGIAGHLFCTASQGVTHGIVLEDNSRVVLKVHQPNSVNPERLPTREALTSIHHALLHLQSHGFPCPRPILGPTPLALGLATVQEFLDVGERGDGFDPVCRHAIIRGLVEHVSLLTPLQGELLGLHPFLQPADRLYPQPHSKLFDFERTAAGAEWIDEIARTAKAASVHGGPPVMGHADWRVEHLRFQDGRISASYDWDSLMPLPETQLVGLTASSYTTDWSSYVGGCVPTVAAICEFVEDYGDARNGEFSKAERISIFGMCVYVIAYGARCQHSLDPEIRGWPEDSWPGLLRTAADALLADSPRYI